MDWVGDIKRVKCGVACLSLGLVMSVQDQKRRCNGWLAQVCRLVALRDGVEHRKSTTRATVLGCWAHETGRPVGATRTLRQCVDGILQATHREASAERRRAWRRAPENLIVEAARWRSSHSCRTGELTLDGLVRTTDVKRLLVGSAK